MLLPLLGALAAFAIIESSGDSGGSSSTSSPPPVFNPSPQPQDHNVIEMTCDQALAVLGPTLANPLEDALLHGTDVAVLDNLADHLDAVANDPSTLSQPNGVNISAALQIAAHCLRARAASLGLAPAHAQYVQPKAA
jgi:hypothetical protein